MNGFIEKYKANAARLNDTGLAKLAADMEAKGYDANPDQWDQLNAAVDALPPESPEEKAKREAAVEQPKGDPKAHAQDHYVSSAPAGKLGNPIGYPGTDQDQDGPGGKKKTVPGVRPTE